MHSAASNIRLEQSAWKRSTGMCWLYSSASGAMRPSNEQGKSLRKASGLGHYINIFNQIEDDLLILGVEIDWDSLEEVNDDE
jgi:hypothetical protein